MVLGSLLLVAGCRLQPAYVVTDLTPQRSSWDSVHVVVAFGKQTGFGKVSPVTPDTLEIVVFDAAFDTLYAGRGPVIPLPDTELGNGERLMVEACGRFGLQRVCEQGTLAASPKRVHVEQEIEYPEDDLFEKGRYQFRFVVERRRYHSEEWERIQRKKPLKGTLRAYVGNAIQEAVKMPFSRHRGRFNLTRYENYRDFRYALETRLLETREADVHFEVETDLGRAEEPPVEKYVSRKTDEDRLAEVATFTEQAGEQVLERFGAMRGQRRAYVFINEWSFDHASRSYQIEMELHWRGSIFDDWHEMVGVLTVGPEGTDALFRLHRGNPMALRQWRSRIDADELALRPLVPLRQRPAMVSEAPSIRKQRLGW